QRHMKDGAVLGDVDVLAAEHTGAALLDAALAGQLAQQHQRLVGDPVLREVEEEPGALGDQALAALGVAGEEIAQVVVADLGGVGLEPVAGGGLAERAPGALRAQAATPRFAPIVFSSSAQDLLKDSLPSSWRRWARAARSIPASSNWPSWTSASA